MIKEVWKDIPGYIGHYQASNLGRIKSLNYKRSGCSGMLKQSINKRHGRYQVMLCVRQKKKMFKVHRLVLAAFSGASSLECNHKNGVKTDNRLKNLEWVTRKQNQDHATMNGFIGKPKLGEASPSAKLRNRDVIKIKKQLKIGITQKSIAKHFKVHPSLISYIKTGKKWKHIY